MRRRRLIAAAGLAVLVAAVALLFWPRPIAPGVTQDNFDRVAVGMSRPEVYGLLGTPGFFERGGGLREVLRSMDPAAHPDRGTATWYDLETRPPPDGDLKSWDARSIEEWASVSFDASGRVSSKYSEKFVVREPVSLQSVLWRARRQWRAWFP